MKDEILEILYKEDYKRLSVNELCKSLGVDDSASFKEIVKTLNSLEDKAIVARDKNNKYDLINRLGFYKGVIDVKDKGFGFVKIDDNLFEDVFIPRNDTRGALNNDYVLIRVSDRKSGNRKEGYVERILERRTNFIVGLYKARKEDGYILPDGKSQNFKAVVSKENSMGAMTNHKVKAEITRYISKDKVECKITDIIGHKNDPGVDILSVVYNYDINPVFPKDAMDHAVSIPSEISESDFVGRTDLRNDLIITIDGDDAKDLDDAVNVNKLENGNYRLGVHIADVSHYVKELSPIDNEAYLRGTSVYLVDRVIPMIPRRLSNGICSLNPHVDRLTLSCIMDIDKQGNVVKYEILPTVINSKHRMTYKNCNKILDGDKSLIKEYDDIIKMLSDMYELSQVLNKRREKRGAINFETKEAKISVDEDGKVLNVDVYDRGISEKIIEEFMLVANETVAEHIHWLNYPFIYRIHEEPDQGKLLRLIKLIRMLGYKIKGTSQIHQKDLQKLTYEITGKPEESAINTLMLRSMAKAKYSHQSIGHYGLSAKYYTHFTSPIRRYPDTIVHRLLREYLFEQKVDSDNLTKWEGMLPDIGEHTSKRERVAVSCERDVSDMKKAEYMEQFIGESFDGIVSSVTSFGIYVEFPNTIEGLVHIVDLDDDFYEYHEEIMTLIGRKTKKSYRIGDKVTVKVESVNKLEGQIDFKIAKN